MSDKGDCAQRDALVERLARELVEGNRARQVRIDRLRAKVERGRRGRQELTAELERSRRRIAELESRLAAVEGSATWRVGRVVLWLPKRLRRRGRG